VILRETRRCTEETDILNELKLPVICGGRSNINDGIFFFMIERVKTREALALHNPTPAQSAAVSYLRSALSMPVCKRILDQDHL